MIDNVNEVLHRIKVKLYPNYLPEAEGTYIARTENEASLSVEQVCAALKNRGGFTGDYDTLVDCVRQYFDEVAYQLCDGFAVSNKYFSVHPNVGGTFMNAAEIHDHEKHPINFRFRVRQALRKLTEFIAVDVEGIADTHGYIDEFIDVFTHTENDALTPREMFIVHGHKIKVAGENLEVGLYFVNIENPAKTYKITAQELAQNSASKIIGIVPTLFAGKFKVVIKSQYNGSASSFLKELRSVESSFGLTCQGI
jgi:hypothetical protein